MLRRDVHDGLVQQASAGDILPLITPELLSDLSGELLELGTRVVGLKLGQRGLYLRTASQSAIEAVGRARPSDPAAWADKELWTPCFKVTVVGTTAAGDATVGGFLSALLRDASAEKALLAVTAVGACSVEATRGLIGVRPQQKALRRVAAPHSGARRSRLALRRPPTALGCTGGQAVTSLSQGACPILCCSAPSRLPAGQRPSGRPCRPQPPTAG